MKSGLQSINSFLNLKSIAFAGLSRNPKSISRTIFKMLKERGYKLYPINPNTEEIEGEKCYKNFSTLPDIPEGAFFIVPKSQIKSSVQDAVSSGIKNIWIQQTSETPEVIKYCKENNINASYGHCILMYAEPVKGFHGFHRWIAKIFGTAAKS